MKPEIIAHKNSQNTTRKWECGSSLGNFPCFLSPAGKKGWELLNSNPNLGIHAAEGFPLFPPAPGYGDFDGILDFRAVSFLGLFSLVYFGFSFFFPL